MVLECLRRDSYDIRVNPHSKTAHKIELTAKFTGPLALVTISENPAC